MYSKLTRNVTVSVVQAIVSGVLLFLLYRYLINHLGAEKLGLWSVILASTSVARLSDIGLTGSVVKFVARYRALKDDGQAAEVVQTAAISIALVMGVLLFAIYPLLDRVLNLSIPAESMPQALSILPWAVLSLWIGSVGGVFQSGLDGCQRVDIRNILMIIGNVLYFIVAIMLAPHYGLVGLALGQVAQGLLLLAMSWLALRIQLTALPWMPMQWSKAKFKEMFGYAFNFQINSIGVLLFEPVTKLLMSKYGGLSSAAYYEMSSQLVAKLRTLLNAANPALVPAVADLHETSPEKVRKLYLKAYRLLFFLVVPFYTSILVSLPMVSALWFGYSEAQFLHFGALLVVGWGLNNLIGPAYFLNLGTGDLKWNSISHIVMAILNILLGITLGPMFGGLGVAVSAMTSLVFASGLVLYATHKKYKIPFITIVPSEHYLLLITVLCYVITTVWINIKYLTNQSTLILCSINLGLYLLLICIVMWIHPYRVLLFERLIVHRK